MDDGFVLLVILADGRFCQLPHWAKWANRAIALYFIFLWSGWRSALLLHWKFGMVLVVASGMTSTYVQSITRSKKPANNPTPE